jgi:hypothetical protein
MPDLETKEQQSLPFEAATADRQNDLTLALARVNANLRVSTLCKRIFAEARMDGRLTGGVGWWEADYDTLAANLCCSQSTVGRTIATARKLGLICVREQSGVVQKNAYGISWEQVSRIVYPHRPHGQNEPTPSQFAVTRPVEIRPTEPTPPEEFPIPSGAWGGGTGNALSINTKEKSASIANPPKNQRPKNQEPKPRARDPWSPPSLGEILPDALNAACDRFTRETGAAACMDRMVTKILNVVPELRPTGVYLAEYVARLVFLENKLHEGHVSRLLSDVDAMRKAGNIHENPGALFNGLLQKLVKKEGIPWNPTGKQTGQEVSR